MSRDRNPMEVHLMQISRGSTENCKGTGPETEVHVSLLKTSKETDVTGA